MNDPEGKRIAVTGASGRLGIRLVKALVSEGARVAALVRNPAKTYSGD